MHRFTATVAVLLAVVALSACGGSNSSDGGPKADTAKPAAAGRDVKGDITLWVGFTQRELAVIKRVVKGFEAKHPGLHVKVVGGINDDKIVAAIRGGHAADAVQSFTSDSTGAFCNTGAWDDLTSYMKRDGVDPNDFTSAARYYTAYKDKRCAMPMLADAYGLYYNKALFKKAGIDGPPKTFSELSDDAHKLTKAKADGSIDVLGFNPNMNWYENAPAHFAPLFGASWIDDAGKSVISKQQGWKDLLQWQRKEIDHYGYDKLVKWQAGAGDEFSPQNAFERGKLAMNLDGEWRVAFLADEKPDLDYGTAPMPVDDAHPELYGAGYTSGSIVGIPRTSKNKEAAWQLLRYLATDEHAVAELANGIKNVPTTDETLKSPLLKLDPKFKVFLDILANPKTATTPVTIVGAANQELFQNFVTKWQAGREKDLDAGLAKADDQINKQLENAAGGQVP